MNDATLPLETIFDRTDRVFGREARKLFSTSACVFLGITPITEEVGRLLSMSGIGCLWVPSVAKEEILVGGGGVTSVREYKVLEDVFLEKISGEIVVFVDVFSLSDISIVSQLELCLEKGIKVLLLYGCSEEEERGTLVWLDKDALIQHSSQTSVNTLSKAKEISEAARAAHQLLLHISKKI